MTWKSVGQSQFPPTHDFSLQESVEGTLEEVRTNVGKNKANVYTLKQKDGNLVSVWGSTVLNLLMADVVAGERILITYRGEKETRRGATPAKIFTVDKWEE